MKKENIRKVILAILFVLILVVIALFIGRFTYSYLGPAPTDELTGTGEVTPSGDTIIFSKGNDLSLSASTDNFHTGSGNLTDTTNPQVRLIASSDTNNASTTYFAGIRIYENTYTYSSGTTAELILSVYDENGTLLEASSDELSFVEVGGVKGFDITGLTGVYNIAIDHPISTTSSSSGTTHTWTFTLTFVNLDTDQSINETANLEMEVVLQKDVINMPSLADVCSSGENLATCIQTLYNTYGEGYDGLYYHDADLANSAADNSYRYAGANPNNYVCFGSDAASCPSANLYRIIGVFGNEVKLIKSTSYGNYAWESDWQGQGNTWNSSTKPDIYTTLNDTYYNSLGTTWQNKIADATWQVGGFPDTYYNDSLKTNYDYEVGVNQTGYEETMKIGLMYVGDYVYASGSNNWTASLYDYGRATDPNEGWLYLGVYEWTISRSSGYSNVAWFVFAGGYLDSGGDYVNGAHAVRPSFYLTSSTTYVSGSGAATDPIVIN